MASNASIFQSDKHYYEQVDGKTSDITAEIPFDIPAGWEWVRLKSICSKIGSGSTPTGGRQIYVPDGIKFLREQNIYNDGLRTDGLAYITDEINKQHNGSQVFARDILMNITGGSIGRTALVDDNFDIANINQHILIIRLIELKMRFFIHSHLLSPYIISLMFDKQTGDKPGLSMEKVARFLMALPPLSEQQRIVSQIDHLMAEVDKIDQEAQELDKALTLAKQKVLDLAIRGKLVPQDPQDEPASELLKRIKAEKEVLIKAGKIKRDKHESFIFRGDDNRYYEQIDGKTVDITEDIPFEIPSSWEWIRLSSVAEFSLGKTLDQQKNTGKFHKYLRSVNVLWGNTALTDIKEMRFEDNELERYTVKQGDLLICEGGDVGRSAVWLYNYTCLYQNALHRVRFYQKCNPFFFQNVMQFYNGIGLLKEISQGVTIKHLTQNTLNSIFFPLPPSNEQERVVLQIKKIQAAITMSQAPE